LKARDESLYTESGFADDASDGTYSEISIDGLDDGFLQVLEELDFGEDDPGTSYTYDTYSSNIPRPLRSPSKRARVLDDE